MLKRALSTVRTRTKIWNSMSIAAASTSCVEHEAASQRFVIYLENGKRGGLINMNWAEGQTST